MALSDRIIALTAAIANAINARAGRVGASAYDLAVLNGYTGTQAQYLLAQQADPRASALARPFAIESFDGGVTGAAWPAQWTLRGNAGTGTTVGTIQSTRGQLVPGSTASNGVRAALENTLPVFGECGIVGQFRVGNDTLDIGSLFINGSGTGTGLLGAYFAPDVSYALVANAQSGTVSLWDVTAAGAGTQLASVGQAFAATTEYRCRLERVGKFLRGKVWRAVANEPEAWSVTAIVPEATPYTGFAGVGARNPTGSVVVTPTWDDIYAYPLEENYGTASVPGPVVLASGTEVAAGAEAAKVVTPAALRAGNLTPPVISTADPTVTSDSSGGYVPGQEWINTANASTYVCISNAVGAAVWRRQSTDIQAFTANGTWTKPAWAMQVEVVCIGSGGGGGSGRRGPSGTAQGGGGGGSGGGYGSAVLQASSLPATVAITTGAGGTGAAAPTADSTNGNAGGAGNASLFGTHVRGSGGGSGSAGASATATGGVSVSGTSAYSTAGGTGGFGAGGGNGGSQGSGTQGATGGGGGGGVSATPAGFSGGNGGVTLAQPSVLNSGAFNTDATAGTQYGTMPGIGGGGGGSGTSSLAAGKGGAGAFPGGGGGGGGASLNGFAAGAGGAGGGGLVLVITT